jgi:hypothetical protein
VAARGEIDRSVSALVDLNRDAFISDDRLETTVDLEAHFLPSGSIRHVR